MLTSSKLGSLIMIIALSLMGFGCKSEPSSMASSSCSSNAQCRGGEVCLGGMCSPVPTGDCQSDSDCLADEYCSSATQTCVSMMATVCTSDLDCPSGRKCDVPQAMCVACLTVADCSMGEQCVAGECVLPGVDAGMTSMSDAATPGPMDAGQMLECTEDMECTPPEKVCEANQCVFGCHLAGGITCNSNEVCNPGTGRCVAVSCNMDSDCNPPQTICESGQCVPGCDEMGGVQCMAPNTCDVATGRCTGGMMGTNCMDDGSEPNDSIQGATVIGGMSQVSNTSCPMNDDVYRVTLAQGDELTVNATFFHSEGNIDLEILDLAGMVVASSSSMDDNESVNYRASRAEDYYVRVFLVSDSGSTPGNTYELTTAVTGQACMSDALEPNDSIMNAQSILLGSQSGLWVCSTDSDFFSFESSVGQTTTFTLSFLPNEGEVSASILDASGTQLAGGMSMTSGEVTVSYRTISAGTYYLQTFLSSDAGTVIGNAYSIEMAVSPTPSSCQNDRLEPNDTFGTARMITAGTYNALASCPEPLDDFYSVNLSSGDSISIDAYFVDAEGDIDIYLFEPGVTSNSSYLARGYSVTDDESIPSQTVMMSGTYTIRVRQYSDEGSFPGNTYSLVVSY